jgi:hypothetical protein
VESERKTPADDAVVRVENNVWRGTVQPWRVVQEPRHTYTFQKCETAVVYDNPESAFISDGYDVRFEARESNYEGVAIPPVRAKARETVFDRCGGGVLGREGCGGRVPYYRSWASD